MSHCIHQITKTDATTQVDSAFLRHVQTRSLYTVFFFQAEDGIRDAQESRGLGDVYKRQDYKGI